MARRLKWTIPAVKDLNEIAEFIAYDSVMQAKLVVKKIKLLALNLVDFPESGRTVPEFKLSNFREKLLYSYRILYYLTDDEILIMGIIHQSRALEKLTNRFTVKEPTPEYTTT